MHACLTAVVINHRLADYWRNVLVWADSPVYLRTVGWNFNVRWTSTGVQTAHIHTTLKAILNPRSIFWVSHMYTLATLNLKCMQTICEANVLQNVLEKYMPGDRMKHLSPSFVGKHQAIRSTNQSNSNRNQWEEEQKPLVSTKTKPSQCRFSFFWSNWS